MPRLKFDLQPLTGWRDDSVEEHNAFLRDLGERHPRGFPHIAPCDCGMFVAEALCSCNPETRARKTPEAVAKELEAVYRRRHLDGLKEKRKFPGEPYPKAGRSMCGWCNSAITLGRHYQRRFHDGRGGEPECRQAFDLHTNLEAQRQYLMRRDGLGCRACGGAVGSWAERQLCDPDKLRSYGRAWIEVYPPDVYVAPFTRTHWSMSLEVDHFVALAVAWEAFPDAGRRRWFFSAANLRLLCTPCHAAKTQEDRALLRECYALGEEHAKARVLDILAGAGLIKATARGPRHEIEALDRGR